MEKTAYKREIRDIERDTVEREQNDRDKIGGNRMQQNGHRTGAPVVDAEVLERIKQRKEEEEKRVNERKLAAAKKLQELEQKINKKKEILGENECELSSTPPGKTTSYLLFCKREQNYQALHKEIVKL